MTKTFANFSELTSELAFDLIERLAGRDDLDVQFGKSNQSCSAYVKIMAFDDEGCVDEDREFKVRFSDHADRHGSDITVRIDHLIETVEDDGEYLHTTIDDWRYEQALTDAGAQVAAFLAKLDA